MSDTNTDYIAVQRCFFFVFLAVILCSNLLSVFFIFFSFSLILFSFENWRYKKQGKNCRSFENWLCGGWLAHDCTCCLSVCVLHVLSVCVACATHVLMVGISRAFHMQWSYFSERVGRHVMSCMFNFCSSTIHTAVTNNVIKCIIHSYI